MALQHSWTYAPLVADVLGMASNRVSVPEPNPAGAAPGRTPALKSYEVRKKQPGRIHCSLLPPTHRDTRLPAGPHLESVVHRVFDLTAGKFRKSICIPPGGVPCGVCPGSWSCSGPDAISSSRPKAQEASAWRPVEPVRRSPIPTERSFDPGDS